LPGNDGRLEHRQLAVMRDHDHERRFLDGINAIANAIANANAHPAAHHAAEPHTNQS